MRLIKGAHPGLPLLDSRVWVQQVLGGSPAWPEDGGRRGLALRLVPSPRRMWPKGAAATAHSGDRP